MRKEYSWAITDNVIKIVRVLKYEHHYCCHVICLGSIYRGCGENVPVQWFHYCNNVEEVEDYIESEKIDQITPAEGSVAETLLSKKWQELRMLF